MSDNEDTTFFKLSRRTKKKKTEENEQSISETWGNIKQSNTHAIGVPEKARKLFEEI